MMDAIERARFARSFGNDPVEYEKYRAERLAPRVGSLAMGALAAAGGRSEDHLGIPEICALMNANPTGFEKWRADQLADARRRAAAGLEVTQTQRVLLGGR